MAALHDSQPIVVNDRAFDVEFGRACRGLGPQRRVPRARFEQPHGLHAAPGIGRGCLEDDQALTLRARPGAERQQTPVGQHHAGFEVQFRGLVAAPVVVDAFAVDARRQQDRTHGPGPDIEGRQCIDVVLHDDEPVVLAADGRGGSHVRRQIVGGVGAATVAQAPRDAQHGAQRCIVSRNEDAVEIDSCHSALGSVVDALSHPAWHEPVRGWIG